MNKEDILNDLDFYSDEQFAKLIIRGILSENDLRHLPAMENRWSNIEKSLLKLKPKPKPIAIEKETILADIDFYTNEQLAIFIERGNLTKDDLINHPSIGNRWLKVELLLSSKQPNEPSTPPQKKQRQKNHKIF